MSFCSNLFFWSLGISAWSRLFCQRSSCELDPCWSCLGNRYSINICDDLWVFGVIMTQTILCYSVDTNSTARTHFTSTTASTSPVPSRTDISGNSTSISGSATPTSTSVLSKTTSTLTSVSAHATSSATTLFQLISWAKIYRPCPCLKFSAVRISTFQRLVLCETHLALLTVVHFVLSLVVWWSLLRETNSNNCKTCFILFIFVRYFLCFSLIELSSSFVIQGRDGPGFLLEGSLMGGVEQCIVVSCRTVFLQFVHSSVTSLESGVSRGGSPIRSASARLWRKERTLCGSHLHRAARLTDPIGCGCGGLFMWTLIERWSDPPTGAALVTEMVEQSVATMSIHE